MRVQLNFLGGVLLRIKVIQVMPSTVYPRSDASGPFRIKQGKRSPETPPRRMRYPLNRNPRLALGGGNLLPIHQKTDIPCPFSVFEWFYAPRA